MKFGTEPERSPFPSPFRPLFARLCLVVASRPKLRPHSFPSTRLDGDCIGTNAMALSMAQGHADARNATNKKARPIARVFRVSVVVLHLLRGCLPCLTQVQPSILLSSHQPGKSIREYQGKGIVLVALRAPDFFLPRTKLGGLGPWDSSEHLRPLSGDKVLSLE